MMESAQGHEIAEFGFAAVHPVPHVMGVDIALMCASGESAAVVAALQRPAYRGRDAAGLAADIEGLAPFILGHRDEARVAGQAPRSLRWQRGTVFDFAASRRATSRSSSSTSLTRRYCLTKVST